jgi:hypothetical protein
MSQTSNFLDVESPAAPSLLVTDVAHRPRLAAPEQLDTGTTATSIPTGSPNQFTSTLPASCRHQENESNPVLDDTYQSIDTDISNADFPAKFALHDTINNAENLNSFLSEVLEQSPRNASGIVRNNGLIATLLGILNVWCLTI